MEFLEPQRELRQDASAGFSVRGGTARFALPAWPKQGFTIVELLVVIAIIGLLMGILLPAIQQSREAGRRITCTSNLKNQALGVLNFVDAHRHFPVGVYQSGTLDHSWCTFILPYIEQEPLYRRMDLSRPWDDPERNKAVAETPLAIFRCPTSFLTKSGGTDYGGVIGSGANSNQINNGIFIVHGGHEKQRPISPADVIDGLSRTIMIGESAGLDGHYEPMWAYRGNCFFANGEIKKDFGDLMSYHPGGVNVGFADGSVKFLNQTMEKEIVWALCTRNGREIYREPSN